MQAKTTLKEKLKSYSVLAGSLAGFGTVANAQIVYTDVTPDYTAVNNNDSFLLDLNNDLVMDFKIKNVVSGPVNYFVTYMYGMNAVAGPMSTVLPYSQI